jgi:hypothetical protein
MDVVTAYLYGSLDLDIYMKVPDGIPIPNMHANRNIYYVKLESPRGRGTPHQVPHAPLVLRVAADGVAAHQSRPTPMIHPPMKMSSPPSLYVEHSRPFTQKMGPACCPLSLDGLTVATRHWQGRDEQAAIVVASPATMARSSG